MKYVAGLIISVHFASQYVNDMQLEVSLGPDVADVNGILLKNVVSCPTNGENSKYNQLPMIKQRQASNPQTKICHFTVKDSRRINKFQIYLFIN